MVPQRDAAGDYRRLLGTLAARARWLGSRDPEAAAQEALKRSWENARSRQAVEYYFRDTLSADAADPEWPLDQFLAWLHAVVYKVIREEQARASFRREVAGSAAFEPVDPAPDPLDALLREEREGILSHCLQNLDRDARLVLTMRADGLKYDEIARRMGVNENTVATWISRGTRALGQLVRRRSAQRRSMA
jgi:RNA polymerase sigma factor (sigma-70 family)